MRSTIGWGKIEGTGASEGGICLLRPVEFPIEGGEEIPPCAIFGFELSGLFRVGNGIAVLVEAGVGGGEIEPGAGFAWGELGGLFRGGLGGGEVVGGIETGGQLNPSTRILGATLGRGLGCLPGIGQVTGGELTGGEDRPSAARFWIESGGFFGGRERFGKQALGKVNLG